MHAVGAQCARELGIVGDEGGHVLRLRRLDQGLRAASVERAAGGGRISTEANSAADSAAVSRSSAASPASTTA